MKTRYGKIAWHVLDSNRQQLIFQYMWQFFARVESMNRNNQKTEVIGGFCFNTKFVLQVTNNYPSLQWALIDIVRCKLHLSFVAWFVYRRLSTDLLPGLQMSGNYSAPKHYKGDAAESDRKCFTRKSISWQWRILSPVIY